MSSISSGLLSRLNRPLNARIVECEQCQRRYATRYYLRYEQRRVGHCPACYDRLKTEALRRAQRRHRKKILLVDDDAHVRSALAAVLAGGRTEILDIYEAADGRAAIYLARSMKPQIVVCDSSMKHGGNLGDRLRSLLPHSLIVSFSGSIAERPWADEIIQKGSGGDLERIERTVFPDR